MRNLSRIVPILYILVEIWHYEPDLRLCQILSNAARHSGFKNPDLFSLEDDELYKCLKRYEKCSKRRAMTELNNF